MTQPKASMTIWAL